MVRRAAPAQIAPETFQKYQWRIKPQSTHCEDPKPVGLHINPHSRKWICPAAPSALTSVACLAWSLHRAWGRPCHLHSLRLGEPGYRWFQKDRKWASIYPQQTSSLNCPVMADGFRRCGSQVFKHLLQHASLLCLQIGGQHRSPAAALTRQSNVPALSASLMGCTPGHVGPCSLAPHGAQALA